MSRWTVRLETPRPAASSRALERPWLWRRSGSETNRRARIGRNLRHVLAQFAPTVYCMWRPGETTGAYEVQARDSLASAETPSRQRLLPALGGRVWLLVLVNCLANVGSGLVLPFLIPRSSNSERSRRCVDRPAAATAASRSSSASRVESVTSCPSTSSLTKGTAACLSRSGQPVG